MKIQKRDGLLNNLVSRKKLVAKIQNKSYDKYLEIKEKTGATQVFFADKIGISKQLFNTIIKSDNISIENLVLLAYIFECDINDLYESEIISE